MKNPESRFNRRDLLFAGAGVAMAKVLTVTTACANQPVAKRAPPDVAAPPRSTGTAAEELAKLSAECTRVGQICMQHCITQLAQGDTSMGPCAQTVSEMLAVCQGTQVLALAGSMHLKQAAALCQAVCESCEAACQIHAGHHAECGNCAAACKATIAAAAALA
jgi:Cys-rich four helix bundle protein (predicted Tat secretion target)